MSYVQFWPECNTKAVIITLLSTVVLVCAEISTLTIISFIELSFHVLHDFWKLKWQDFVISSQLCLIYCVFSVNRIKCCSTCKYSCHCTDCFDVIFFPVLIFWMPSIVIIKVIQFMLLDKNIFWTLFRVHFNPCRAAQLKWVWVGPKTYLLYPQT